MKLQHGNRIRQKSGRGVSRAVEALEAGAWAEAVPTEVEIRRRAYEIYLRRQGAPGNAVVDWLQAEIELRSCNGIAPLNDAAEAL